MECGGSLEIHFKKKYEAESNYSSERRPQREPEKGGKDNAWRRNEMEKDEGLWCPHWHPQNTWEEVEPIGNRRGRKGQWQHEKCNKVKDDENL